MFVWSIIMVSYLAFLRRRPQLHAASAYRMPGARFMPWVVLAFFAFMLWALGQAEDTRLALVVAPLWFLSLGAAWYVNRKAPLQQARIEEWKAEARAEKAALVR
jgi:D-serine/D-alanine/glycine transporter